jgi:hypothetical protein
MFMCDYNSQCPVKKSDLVQCNGEYQTCSLYQRISKPASIDETIKELDLSEGDVAKIHDRMHESLDYYMMMRKEGSFVDNYRNFFRIMAIFYYYEN